jgi:hypothetical protein
LVIKENTSNFSTSVIRPPLIWGVGSPLLPDVVREVRSGRFGWIDRGEYEFSACHVRNVVQAILLAAERASGGRSYFVTDGRNYVFRRFFTELLATQETSAPSRSFPFRVAWTLAPVVEGAWSVLHLKNDPPLTRQMVRMIGLPFTLNIDRARQELPPPPRDLSPPVPGRRARLAIRGNVNERPSPPRPRPRWMPLVSLSNGIESRNSWITGNPDATRLGKGCRPLDRNRLPFGVTGRAGRPRAFQLGSGAGAMAYP